MAYTFISPVRLETWITDGTYMSPYARLAARPVSGLTGNPKITDIPRPFTLLVNGTTVTAVQTPYQDDLADADYYYLGGHSYTITDAEAQILIDAGYGDSVTPV
jgi:hypothetical protein